jgi:arylsulfatase A-like enzyme
VPASRIEVPFPGNPFLIAGTYSLPKEQYSAWMTTDLGIGMLRERARQAQPFFLRIDIQEPHFPNVIPEPYASMYDPNRIPPWPNFDETFVDKPASHLRKHKEWHLEGKDWAWWRQIVAKYYGDVTLIDDCVGRVLEAISAEGLEKNTVFIFTTDHGDATGSHKHFEKAGTMYEEIFRIPLLVRMPRGMGKSGVVREFARCLDLMPTIVELAGCSLPKPVDGLSLVLFLKGGKPASWPDSVYCEHHGEVWGYQSQRMVRTHDWKYVYNPTDLDELYDMKADPFEMKNRISDPACAAILAEMKGRLLGWNDATKDMFQWIWVRSNFPAPIPPL